MRSALGMVLLIAVGGLLQWQFDALPFPDLGNLTASAILGWFAWHTAARTIPQLVQEFRAEMALARAETAASRALFREELIAERQQRHADHLLVLGALEQIAQLK